MPHLTRPMAVGKRSGTGLKMVALVSIITSLLVGGSGAPAEGSTTWRIHSQLAPGVGYTEIRTAGPERIKILTIDPSAEAVLDVATAGSALPAFDQTSDMAARGGAIAAVNGDFGLYPGRPAHAYMQDGIFEQTSLLGITGSNFATGPLKDDSVIGRPDVSIEVHQSDTNRVFSVDRWNEGSPRNPEVAGYSPFGGRLEKPPAGACSARLIPRKPLNWGASGGSVTRSFTVGAVRCDPRRMVVRDDVILVARPGTHRARDIASLSVGEEVTIESSMGWTGITDSIGGSPILIDDGEILVSECSSYLCTLQPRTAMGITASGQLLLVTIDGRQPGFSIGMTQVEEARFMKSLGAVWAINLDGGGSTTMWVKGRGVVNSPSDGSERSVSSAVLVLPGADPGEQGFGSGSSLSPVQPTLDASDASDRTAFLAALTDPGSTGGLLDELARSGQQMSGRETAWVDRFRASQAVSP